ncbi:MAG: 4-alpha-glucanotransferase [Firmicutes bacterium]|nr:4-alpha-glucanotransferase [Bacillota bacterium]
MHIYHDSRNETYRTPFGAAEVSTSVRIALSAPDAAGAVLHCWNETEGDSLIDMELREDGLYEAEVKMPPEGCTVWYYFIVKGNDGNTYLYGNAQDGLGGEGCQYEYDPKAFQITVYKPARVPQWYLDGAVYQIFPDRFAPDPESFGRDAKVLGKDPLPEAWYKKPFYKRDEEGKVTEWDFYGGTLKGIEAKLPYIQSLGITAIYLNPIFKAYSNHRYDTADYMNIDPRLGTNEDFTSLCKAAEKRGISIILDGVFSHTGSDSIYFDRYGRYGNGAWENEDSPYRSWYKFTPDKEPGYSCWWGTEDLPEVDETVPAYNDFICGEEGVVRHWLKAGARGFRLDVADELPDSFIKNIRKAVKAEGEDKLLIGEVWEDASNKISYGEARKFLFGEELDATMHYPFRNMVLDYINGNCGGGGFSRRMQNIRENYPREYFYSALNLIGSHDRERAMTALGADQDYWRARARLKLASALQYACPGVPCTYYGDEDCLQGWRDPENRAGYPWGREDKDMIYHYRLLGQVYSEHPALKGGEYIDAPGYFDDDIYAFLRKDENETILVLANRSPWATRHVSVDVSAGYALELLSAGEYRFENGHPELDVPPLTIYMLLLRDSAPELLKMERSAGVLCHVTSIPGSGSKGTIGKEARDFVDWIASAGFRLWQILPLNKAGREDTPYLSPAVFAGETSLIDRGELPDLYGMDDFRKENDYWLDDYIVYELSQEGNTKSASEIETEQYYFFSQWKRLKKYANDRGISIIGDIPFYVAPDGADIKAHPEAFQTGESASRAGVPPDYFSKTGQDWGNPLYDWKALKKDGYRWWLERLKSCARLYDYIRLDHFRAFSAYYEIPSGGTAMDGSWIPGPGKELMDLFKAEGIKLIAEDLGELDPPVTDLLILSGLPGMDIWQFSEEKMRAMSPEKIRSRIFYSGTHDNDTLLGWCRETTESEKEAREKMDSVLKELYASGAPWVVVQLQDVLGLGSEARMNVPGTAEGNWHWRAGAGTLTAEVAERFRKLAEDNDR